MSKFFSSNKIRILIIILAVALAAGISLYRSRSTKLLDKEAYSSFKEAIDDVASSEAHGFSDQRALMDFIESWADSNLLEYKEDASGNIIFDKAAVNRKKNVSPTLIAVSMNYETAIDNSQLLASAASIALSDVESGRRTVVFFNDEQALAKGYKGLNKKYISSKSKIIYLDKGSATYLSTGSFQERFTYVTIPAKKEKNTFDTAVHITIRGIKSGVIGPSIDKQPDPIAAFSSLLTRLKSKSVVCGLSDLEVGSNGNMYPVSVEATISLNSYNLSSFTSYIDKRIKAWMKTYGDDFDGLVYEYEVIEGKDQLPEKVYNAETIDKLTGILYTIRSGAYRYSKGDAVPDGKDVGDIYGINCLTALKTGKGNIKLRVIVQGVNDSFTDRLFNDNKAAADLYECSYEQTALVKAFLNERDSLSRTFKNTYSKVNKGAVTDNAIRTDTDNFFTPCSYLAAGNSKADIIHIRTKGSDAADIANTILCYIKTKGNTSIFK